MNPNTENFDQLRKLLALKRYELPPPRYFNEFSGRVMARLAEPERQPLTSWQRLGFDFDLRPAAMCGLGVVVCGLLSFGVIGAMQMTEPDAPAAVPGSFVANPMTPPAIAGIAPVPGSIDTASIAPLITRQAASPFNQFGLAATPVSFGTFGSAH
ncbi:MAG TPA: hypothetical protein VKM56_01020 [Verrucomicrobiae bacterium]|nr:hypothetical protein [Verrucomicrobiae bacterium]